MVRTRKKSQMSESEDEVASVTARRSSRRSSRSTTKVLYEEDDIDPEALQGSIASIIFGINLFRALKIMLFSIYQTL